MNNSPQHALSAGSNKKFIKNFRDKLPTVHVSRLLRNMPVPKQSS